MNIGIVTTWFERGAAYVSKQYAKALQGKFNVYIYARGGEHHGIGDPAWDTPNVWWGERWAPKSLGIDLSDFKAWLRNKKIDVVFFNEQQRWQSVILCNKLGIKVATYVDYYTEETIPLFQCYDFLICNTVRHFSAFDWHPQAYYIPWGTDLNVFMPQSFDLSDPDKITFFHSCGLNPHRKGTDIVLESFQKLIDRYPNQAKLVLHSQVSIQKIFPHLEDVIEDLQKKGDLCYFQKTISAPGLYFLGDVYVYPSRLDGIGLTIAEALACGLPVITSDYPPMNEFIDSTNGKLVKISKVSARSDGYYWPQCLVDSDALCVQMSGYLEQKGNMQGLKLLARKSAETRFDWIKNEEQICSVFSSSKLLPESIKLAAVQKAECFESNKTNFKEQVFYFLPSAFKFAHRTRDFLRKVVGKDV